MFVIVYLARYWQLWRRGHKVSFEKVFLLASTGFCSVYTWGFNSWGEAFFIMNLFHAVQYLALVWAMERNQIIRRFRVDAWRLGWVVALGGFLGLVLVYGFAVQLLDPGIRTLWAITLMVSLMHFYYDAFVWSVRKSQV